MNVVRTQEVPEARATIATSRRSLLNALLVVVAGCFLTATAVGGSTGNPPNIILIMADDLGVEGLNCYGGESYDTPTLDRLAAEGIRFTHAYSQPLCTNTRIQLMTGLYNNRNWVAFGILDPKAKTIGHYMRDAGYDTCIVGKWQLQSYDPPDYPGAHLRRGKGMRVEDAGFDEYCLWHTGHTEVKGSRYADPVVNQNGSFIEETEGEYGPDIWVDYIRKYLDRKQDTKKPFFIYYPMALPHWPHVPTPDSEVWSEPDRRLEEDDRYFTDMVEYTDKCVGRIVDEVDSLGLGNDTLIVFYSDNGTNRRIVSQMANGQIVGGKGLTTDAGTHVPMIARWSGTIKPGVNDDLIDSTDFVVTLREAAREPIPNEYNLDGVSFYPQLLGQQGNPRDWIFCHFEPRPGWDKDQFTKLRFARGKRYKLYDDGRFFDVANDPREENAIPRQEQTPAQREERRELRKVLERMPDPKTPPRE